MSNEGPAGAGEPLGAWWVLPSGLLVSLGFLVGGGLRSFGYAVAVTLTVAAVIRLMLPQARAGGLLVRTRAVDVGLFLVLAVAIAVLSANLVIR